MSNEAHSQNSKGYVYVCINHKDKIHRLQEILCEHVYTYVCFLYTIKHSRSKYNFEKENEK